MKTDSEKFVGSWHLIEWTAELTNGEIIFPSGKDAKGRITYEAEGDMAVQIMKNNPAKFLSEDPLQARPNEIVDSYGGFIAYCGQYVVNHNSNQVVHQIEISSFPNWVGQNQVRYYEFRDDLLILSTDVIGSGRHKLIWKR